MHKVTHEIKSFRGEVAAASLKLAGSWDSLPTLYCFRGEVAAASLKPFLRRARRARP